MLNCSMTLNCLVELNYRLNMNSIAIIGIGCRFPGANTPEEFWQLLINGKDAVSTVPADRWSIDEYCKSEQASEPSIPGKTSTQWGGYLNHPIDQFDAEFFNISPKELENIDPQQRLMLEVAWEAIEHAAIAPDSLSGSKTGVYVGMSTIDYHRYLYKHTDALNPYSGTGTSPCIAANRVSFHLNLRGPSFSLDSACSSSLLALHLASQSLRSRESDLCLVGGVNLMLAPEPNIQLSQGRMLAVDGRCKAFDASADGYGRGEGCGVVLLKRLEDALADGDNVIAVVEGSAVNQDGLSNGLTAPNGVAQKEVIGAALAQAGVEPKQISYVESHAVGTPLGDAIELKSLTDVLMADRAVEQRCWVGSVKTNIGHLEAAAGMAAVIKVALSLQHEKIPANLHFSKLNPYISKKKKTALAFPQEPQDWPKSQERFAGVSAFSYGGTNCHLVMSLPPTMAMAKGRGADKASGDNQRSSDSGSAYHFLTLSAKSEQALKALVKRYYSLLQSPLEFTLADICFTANTGRSHFDYRAAFVCKSIEDLAQQLDSFLANKPHAGMVVGQATKNKRKKIGYVLDRPDLALFRLGAKLYKTQAVFRKSVDCYEGSLIEGWGQPVGDLLEIAANETDDEMMGRPVFQVLGAVVAYAVGELWQSWGVKPAAIVGYGTGKYAAAGLAGVLQLSDGLKLLSERLRLLGVTVYGAKNVTDEEKLQSVIDNIHYTRSNTKWVSEIDGELLVEENALTPGYWLNDFQGATDFAAVKATWDKLGCEPTLKISGHVDAVDAIANDAWATMLCQLGRLYITGVSVDWANFYHPGSYRRLHLPTYPFQRERYWFEQPRCVESSLSE